ncbi:cupin domain-containing protein [Bacillus timonensis]|nr:cupin domain-containing protein [Bacillus timonensis]
MYNHPTYHQQYIPNNNWTEAWHPYYTDWRNTFWHQGHYNPMPQHGYHQGGHIKLKDYGKRPYVVDINKATIQNNTYRTALWTGKHLQMTVMSIGVGESIGLEVHPKLDQFIRIEQGQGVVQMGDQRDQLDYVRNVYDDFAILIPAGKWHNVTNTGNVPMKLYAIYAPPEHPFGTVHQTKAIAMAAEDHHS